MTVITWIAVAVVFFILFVIFLFAGIIRKKVWMIIVAVLCVGLGMAAGSVALIRLSSVAMTTISNATETKTAEEVYASEFGRPQDNCVQVADYHDPTVTDRTYICFTSCPQETARVMALHKYDVVKRATDKILGDLSYRCCHAFVSRERFGDTLLECLTSEGKEAYTLYVSMDSTRVYYVSEVK